MEKALETNKLQHFLFKKSNINITYHWSLNYYLFIFNVKSFFVQIDFIYEIHSSIASPYVVYIHVPTPNTK